MSQLASDFRPLALRTCCSLGLVRSLAFTTSNQVTRFPSVFSGTTRLSHLGSLKRVRDPEEGISEDNKGSHQGGPE